MAHFCSFQKIAPYELPFASAFGLQALAKANILELVLTMRIRHQSHHSSSAAACSWILASVKFVQLLNVQTAKAFPLSHDGDLIPSKKKKKLILASHFEQ